MVMMVYCQTRLSLVFYACCLQNLNENDTMTKFLEVVFHLERVSFFQVWALTRVSIFARTFFDFLSLNKVRFKNLRGAHLS